MMNRIDLGNSVNVWRYSKRVLGYLHEVQTIYRKSVMQPRVNEQLNKGDPLEAWTVKFMKSRVYLNCRCNLTLSEKTALVDDPDLNKDLIEQCPLCDKFTARIIEAGMGWYKLKCLCGHISFQETEII